MRRAGLPPMMLLLLGFAMWAGVAASQEPLSVEATADRSRVTVGDRVTLTVVVRHDPSFQLAPLGPMTNLGDFEVIELLPTVTSSSEGLVELRLRYVVSAFKTGVLGIEHPPIPYTAPDGMTGAVGVPRVEVGVASVLTPGEPPADIKDLKPQISLGGSPPPPLLRGLAAAATAVVLTVAGGYLWRRYQRRPATPLPPPASAPSPSDVARAELDRILSLGLLHKGDYKGYYSLIARCVRRYVQESYDFPATAFTTAELPRQMRSRNIDRWQVQVVEELLAECDAVNYAQYLPATARAEGDLEVAYSLVTERQPARLAPLAGE